MSRFSRFALLLSVAIFCAGIVATIGLAARAQSADPRRGPALPARTHATPPPLPLNGLAGTPLSASGLDPASAARKPLATSRMIPIDAPRPKNIPTLGEALRRLKGKRSTMAASGATIVLTGDLNYTYLNDQTLPYNAQVFYLCQNMQPNSYFRYVIFPPNGGAFSPGVQGGDPNNFTVFQSNGGGNCISNGTYNYAYVALSTPVNVGTDPAYPGVWTVAVQRGNYNTGSGVFTPVAYDSVAYTVVIATQHFDTYSDPGFATLGKDYQPGQSVYFKASGLTPSDQYAFGIVYTGGNNTPCVFTFPGAAQNSNSASCFHGGAGKVTGGIVPTGGVVSGSWSIPAAPNTGTYSVQLYDATTQNLISTQQISVQPSTVAISVVPLSGGTPGTNYADTFATDGILSANGSVIAEQSVTGLNVTVSPVVSGRTYAFVLSTPNGAVLTNTPPLDSQTLGAAQTATASGTTMTVRSDFPINTANFTGIGPTLTSFAPNVMTMQVYDTSNGSVVGSKSFHILAYRAGFQWTSPAGSSITVSSGGTGVQATVTNSGDSTYGTTNGDGIKTITFAPDINGFVALTLTGTTATDSDGQSWTLTSGTGGTIVATPAISTQFLKPNSTIAVPMTVAVAAGNCKTAPCSMRTSITPYHGINPSTYNVATNALLVYGPGGTPANSTPYYSWRTGPGPGGLGTPRFTQMMYEHGTQGVTSGNYTMNMSLVNCGASENLQEIKFVMPASFDANAPGQAPSLTSVNINGVAQNWTLYTKSSSANNRSAVLQQNEFAIGCTNVSTANGCGIPFAVSCGSPANYTAAVVLSWPIPLLTFPLQDIQAYADYQGGCDNAACGMAQYAVGAAPQLVNTVAGPQNVDSTQLGFYSLDGTLMSALWNPNTVPQGVATTSQFKFTNTSTSSDPNPDYVDELQLDVPAGAIPTSITMPTNWYQNSTAPDGSGGTIYTVSVCSAAAPPCGISPPQNPGGSEPNALAPGGQVGFTFVWGTGNLPAVGTYSIKWKAFGANGGARTNQGTASILFANTTAQASFVNSGGGNGTPTGTMDTVVAGQQATVGSDADPVFGNGFVLNVYNNGSQTITSANINIPATDIFGAKPSDSAHDWQLTGVYVYPGNGGTNCSGTVPTANITLPVASSGTAGQIRLSGCTLATGANLQIFFNGQAPYDQPNHYYRFNGTVSSALTSNAPTQTTSFSTSDTVLVVNDARLRIFIPNAGNTINNGFGTGGTYNATCTGCTYTPGTLPVINLGTFTGTFTANDIVNAAITSDAQGSHGWQLYVQMTSAPPTSGTLVTAIDTSATVVSTSPYYTANQTALTTIPTTNPGLLLSSFTGATASSTFSHSSLQNLMNFQVQIPSLPATTTPSANSVTLLYTLIPN
ncbi:MAG: hypothetical protein NVS2B17_06890 [Candidatus Velthaea sp.]